MIRPGVPIVTTACNYGGSRPWFRCICARRVSVLFDGMHAYYRLCLGLSYACQQETARYRPLLRAQAIRLRLSGSESLLEPFPDGPHPHRKTYEKLRGTGIALEQRVLSRTIGGLPRLRFMAANAR